MAGPVQEGQTNVRAQISNEKPRIVGGEGNLDRSQHIETDRKRQESITKKEAVAGEMAQWIRALAALPEDPGSIPSTHMAAHNCL